MCNIVCYLHCADPEAIALGGGVVGSLVHIAIAKIKHKMGSGMDILFKSEIGYNYISGSAHCKSPTGGTDTAARPNRLLLLGSVLPPLISLSVSHQYHQYFSRF